MILARNKKAMSCAICRKDVGPGEGWAWKSEVGWVPVCEEHKPEPKNLLEQLRANNDIVKLQGKEFVLFSGLLSIAHNNGLESLETTLEHVDWEKQRALTKCVAKGVRGTFTAYGDATPENTSKMVRSAFVRMSETRAIARSLRFYNGIGMTARDELPGKVSSED